MNFWIGFVPMVCFNGMLQWYASMVCFNGMLQWYASMVCFNGMSDGRSMVCPMVGWW